MRNQITHLIKGELIGKTVKVINDNQEIDGIIINETKHTIIIKTKTSQNEKTTKNKKIIKNKKNKFQFEIAKITITGEKLIGSPEERIKSK